MPVFVIVVYDVSPKRDALVLKVCRQYLTWVQNSVFEGDVTETQMRIFWQRLGDTINKQEDSVVAYTFDSMRYSARQSMGVKKGGEEWVV